MKCHKVVEQVPLHQFEWSEIVLHYVGGKYRCVIMCFHCSSEFPFHFMVTMQC